MSDNSELLREIEAYATKRGIALTTFGRMAVSDSYFVDRLRRGGSLLVRTEDRVREFMRQPFPARRPAPEAANV